MTSLYEIQKNLSAILDELSTCEDDDHATQLMAHLDILEVDRDKKLFGLISAYKNMRGDLEAHELEIARLKKAKESIDKGMERIEKYLRATIGAGNPWKSGVHAIKWRPSERCELREGITADHLPPCYQKVKYSADITLLKEDLKMLGDEDGPIKKYAELKAYWNLTVA